MGEKTVPLHIRLMPDIDAAFREHIRHRGDVTKLILSMLKEVNLRKTIIPTICFGESGAEMTFCNLPEEKYMKLKRVAVSRGCSVNALLNSGIEEYTRLLKQQLRGDYSGIERRKSKL
jgi:hypothetical protein